MNIKELQEALKQIGMWVEWERESLEGYHAYAQLYRCQPGANVFDFVLQDALRYRRVTFNDEMQRLRDENARLKLAFVRYAGEHGFTPAEDAK